jgi:hypothetical protein
MLAEVSATFAYAGNLAQAHSSPQTRSLVCHAAGEILKQLLDLVLGILLAGHAVDCLEIRSVSMVLVRAAVPEQDLVTGAFGEQVEVHID